MKKASLVFTMTVATVPVFVAPIHQTLTDKVEQANGRLSEYTKGKELADSYKQLLHDAAKLGKMRMLEQWQENVRIGIEDFHVTVSWNDNPENESSWNIIFTVELKNF